MTFHTFVCKDAVDAVLLGCAYERRCQTRGARSKQVREKRTLVLLIDTIAEPVVGSAKVGKHVRLVVVGECLAVPRREAWHLEIALCSLRSNLAALRAVLLLVLDVVSVVFRVVRALSRRFAFQAIDAGRAFAAAGCMSEGQSNDASTSR